ncbi:MAG: family N-acetyltransferase [Paenibacillus sp.]|nr:family N-acetyltransferase [Paenibacillus sp.]
MDGKEAGKTTQLRGETRFYARRTNQIEAALIWYDSTGGSCLMIYHTTGEWDEVLWSQAELVYKESFPEHGRKNRSIIRRMFERQMCYLHTAAEGGKVIAMALTGINKEAHALLIDYLAVKKDLRSRGCGRLFMEYIKGWAGTVQCQWILIEVESEPTPENARRIRFWEQCGFRLTDYVHHYIWVPEPYRAMYVSLQNDVCLTDDGETLFRYIVKFHRDAYRA